MRGKHSSHGAQAVVSHFTAAMVWEILKERPGPVHLTLPTERRDRPGIKTHESRTRSGVRIFYGLRVTDPIRTLVDLADLLTTDELEGALSEAHRLGYVDQRHTEFPRTPGRKGLAAVLQRGVKLTRSQLESLFLSAIRAATDLPQPQTNARIGRYEADFDWPEYRLVVEIDHYATHGDRRAFERDRRKQTAFALKGILIVRFTEETMHGAVDAVRALISDRSGRLYP